MPADPKQLNSIFLAAIEKPTSEERTAFLGEAVHQIFTLAAAQGEGESYVPALARALGKVNGVAIGPQA